MITQMSKYAFMVFHQEYNEFLGKLRDLGVLHIRETNSILDNEQLQTLLAERKRVNLAIRFCKSLNEKEKVTVFPPATLFTRPEGFELVDKYDFLLERRAQDAAVRATLEKDIAYMQIWGDFSYENINALDKAGWEINFFSCPTTKYEPKWGDAYNALLINEHQSQTFFLTVTKPGTHIDIDADRPKMPDRSLADLQAAYADLQTEQLKLEQEIRDFAVNQLNNLIELENNLTNEFNLSNALVQTDKEAGEKLMILEGYVPETEAKQLEDTLDKEGYYFMPMDIPEGEKVPIKLHNNNFTRLYEPITKMFSLPNYAEFDPTPFFAPFFMLFFGLCFGDGGYGMLVMLICAIMKRKKPALKPYFNLFMYLGLSATVIGLLSGSFFGLDLPKLAIFAKIKDYFISSDNLMTFSIVIGLVQIIFGKTVAAFKRMSEKGTKHGIAPLAWVFIITSLACVFGLPELDIHISKTLEYIFFGIAGLGLLVAFLYNMPGRNIFMNFGNGIWNTYNIASGLLGDTLSYIRLFAIGLTGAILGGVFNSLAMDMTEGMNIFVKILCMLPILVIGHTINICLCTISSLVHPLRLIFVEYYKNAEFEGGGKAYEPFKKL